MARKTNKERIEEMGRLYTDGVPARVICEKYGITDNNLRATMCQNGYKRNRRVVDPEINYKRENRIERMAEMYISGKPVKEIAEAFAIKPGNVRASMRYHGYKRERSGKEKKTESFSFSCTQSERREIERLAKMLEVKYSEAIRQAIRETIERRS